MAEQENPPSASATTKATASRSGGAVTAPASPEEELKKLKEAMLKDQKEADKLKKNLDKYQSQIKEYEKSISETNKITGGFEAAMQSVATDLFEIQDFIANELPQIVSSDEVKNHKAEIDARIKEGNDAITAKDDERKALEGKLTEQKTASQAASDDAAKKKQALDDLKDRQRAIQEAFTKLKKLRQRIDGEAANKPILKYVLALELKDVWDKAKVLFVTKEELQTEYYAKAEDVRTSAAAAAEAETNYKQTQTDLDSVRKDLDARRNARLDDLIKRVSDIGTREPAASSSYSAAAARA